MPPRSATGVAAPRPCAAGMPSGERDGLTAGQSQSTDGGANHETPDPASRAVDILGDDVPTAVAQHVRTQRLGKRLLADAPCERFLRTRAVHRALANRTGRDPVGVARDDLVAAETGITLVSLLALDSLGSVITVRTLRAGVALVALRSLGARIALRALRAGGQLADVEVGRHQRPVLDLGSCDGVVSQRRARHGLLLQLGGADRVLGQDAGGVA